MMVSYEKRIKTRILRNPCPVKGCGKRPLVANTKLVKVKAGKVVTLVRICDHHQIEGEV